MCVRLLSSWLLVSILSLATLLAGGVDAPLADAVQRMDRVTIRGLLQESIDVNASQVDGMTALHWAAYHDDLDILERLVRAGADVEVANRYGVTPLSLACTNANADMVELLLGAGADPNMSLPGGETVLMTAARTGRVGAVKALLANGADVHSAENRRGQTALMWAAAEGHVEVVEELIRSGADFRAPLDSGFTPLLFAVREGRIGVVRVLLKAGVDVNETVQLNVAKRQSFPGRRPVRAGASALLVAATNAHFDLGVELLEAGADPNTDRTGYTVLHAMPRVRNSGAGDNDPVPEGSGRMTSLEFVRKLVAYGADLNARMTEQPRLNNTRLNELGATPFLLAAQTADVELMRVMVELGADPLLPTGENSTPLMAAAGLGTRSPGEDAGTEEEVLEALRVVLDLGVDVNAVDDHGETAMHGAAYKNLPRAVEFLVDAGAEIGIWNQPNEFGWTPLTIARGYRFGNYKPSPVTMAAVEGVMLALGVIPPTEEEEAAKAVDPYAKRPSSPR